ncbi:MAG: CHASE3 domain-containing protein [Bryobacteraceae bacterium]|jgi:hypothetical protein
MESQLQAYEITQMPVFLAAGRAKQSQTLESLENLRRLTVDSSAQQSLVDQLEKALRRRSQPGTPWSRLFPTNRSTSRVSSSR